MADWVLKGSLKGPQGEPGETPDLSGYATTSALTQAVAAESSAREKADELLHADVDAKMAPDDIVAGENVSVQVGETGTVTISAEPGLPEGGSVGDVLVKTDGGESWASNYVKVNDSGDYRVASNAGTGRVGIDSGGASPSIELYGGGNPSLNLETTFGQYARMSAINDDHAEISTNGYLTIGEKSVSSIADDASTGDASALATAKAVKDYVDSAASSGGFDVDKVYPVGSIYMSVSYADPGSLFGGTWDKISGRFLLAADSSHEAGSTGGSNDAVVVQHSHTASTGTSGSHSHDATTYSGGSHTHSISGGSHSHSASTSSAGSHYHDVNTNLGSGWSAGGTTDRLFYGKYQSGRSMGEFFGIPSAGAHTHTVSVSTSSSHSHSMTSAGSHSHTVDVDSAGGHSHTVSVNSTGSSGTDKNMPAYLAVNMWQRVA